MCLIILKSLLTEYNGKTFYNANDRAIQTCVVNLRQITFGA